MLDWSKIPSSINIIIKIIAGKTLLLLRKTCKKSQEKEDIKYIEVYIYIPKMSNDIFH